MEGKQRGCPKKADNGQIIAAYIRGGSVWKAAEELGMCGQSVHERLVKLGMTKPINIFSDEEKQILREQYQSAADAGKLADLALAMGRTKAFICRQARALGITDQSRTRAYLAESSAAAMKAWHAVNDHPRGMLGKKHAESVCAEMSVRQLARWAAMTEEQRDAELLKQLKGRARKNGGNLVAEGRADASWKSGWREIGGQRCFFRSTWEANYARYLETLRVEGKITSWEHEPKTFWFEEIKRGTMTYLPDFKVVATDGSVTWHEVKGWMDDRSKTKIARMAKYFPEVALIVIGKDEYRKMSDLYRYVIDGWERPVKPTKKADAPLLGEAA